MKFLCDQCKAKYQIADEKVAGKTVRMKCRKCGHMIEVKSEVTETSVASALPPDDSTRVGGAADPASMMNVTTTPGRPAGAPRPAAPAAPRAPASKLSTSLGNQRPTTASRPPTAARPDSALAGAFQKSVKEEARLPIATNAEWYVAINGVPVGPIRLTELRRKAASGAITDDSLCWQDGMEEWRPLKSVTELSEIVHEALAGARPSLASPAPVDSHPSLTPAPPARVEASRPHAPHAPRATPGPSRVEPGRPLAPAARNNVVSLSSRLATAERLEVDEHPEDRTMIGDPFAALAPEPSAAALPLVAPATTGTTSQPIVPVAPPFHFPEAPPQKKAPNWIAIAMIVLAGAFGITAAIALFVRPAPAPTPAATTVASAATPPPTAPTGTAIAAVDPTATAAASASGEPRVALATNAGGAGTKPAATASAKPTGGGAGDIASLLGGPTTGPNVGGGGGGGGGGGSALSQEAIEGVVRSRTPGVKRTCWERGGGTESNVNVTVKLVISSSGAVSNASATGNDPIVTKCIENQTRSWQFPASNGSTNVDIPFHFLRQ